MIFLKNFSSLQLRRMGSWDESEFAIVVDLDRIILFFVGWEVTNKFRLPVGPVFTNFFPRSERRVLADRIEDRTAEISRREFIDSHNFNAMAFICRFMRVRVFDDDRLSQIMNDISKKDLPKPMQICRHRSTAPSSSIPAL